MTKSAKKKSAVTAAGGSGESGLISSPESLKAKARMFILFRRTSKAFMDSSNSGAANRSTLIK